MVDYLRSGQWCCLLICLFLVVKSQAALNIPITILQSAKAKGAVCLDGSPPAYFMEKGTGTGINSWIILMEGGGWCETIASCLERRNTYKGSSLKMNRTTGFNGFIGPIPTSNPDFYNWNKVKINYCDGSSFTGDVQAVDPKTNLYFRGGRIWQAVMEDLLAKGLKTAKQAILTGCSAGSLAAILHCDQFKYMLPKTARVKCVSDAGYFIRGMDINKGYMIEDFFNKVATLHGSAKHIPKSCTQTKPGLCFFPQFVTPTMSTPLFLINSAYDSWQIKNILASFTIDPKGLWSACKTDYAKCTPDQMKLIHGYRTQFLEALNSGAGKKPANGYFIDSCYAHCQTSNALTWMGPKAIKVANKELGKAVGDWFFDRAPCKVIDGLYPSNPTCPPIPPIAAPAV
ncbi:Pectinacetylesterase family protein [Euphorbia peplus]|nr:Pectinacetylesterase family protein [Euphorbia peplus]